mgnify:FL=1
MKKVIKKYVLAFYLGFYFFATKTFAAIPILDQGDLASGNKGIPAILGNIIDWVLGFAALIAVLFIIISGIRWIIAAGNADQAKSARQALTSAVIGLIIIILSYFIVRFVIALPTILKIS